MKKHTPMSVGLTLNRKCERLTIGLDLGDRSSCYCVLDEAGDVLLEQKVSTTPKEEYPCLPSPGEPCMLRIRAQR
jgi:transposase